MPRISRRDVFGMAAAVAAAASLPNLVSARETELREPDKPIVRGKPMKVSLDFLNFIVAKIPLEQRYDATARLGYNYISLMDPKFPGIGSKPNVTHEDILRHKKLIKDAGLEVATIVTGFPIAVTDEAKRKEGVEAWKREIEIGLELGVKRFNTELGEGLEDPKKHAEQMTRSLDELVPYLEKMGVHLDVESHPNDFYERHTEAYPLIAHYNSKALGYLYAIPHSFYYDDGKGDAASMLRDCAPHLTHVIIADSRNKWIPFRYNINPTTSPARLHDHYPYKTGDLNWPSIWDTLRELKFADSADHIANVTMFGSPATFESDAMEFRRVIQQEIGGH